MFNLQHLDIKYILSDDEDAMLDAVEPEVDDEYSDELDEGDEDTDELIDRPDEDDEDTYVDVPLDEVELPVQ